MIVEVQLKTVVSPVVSVELEGLANISYFCQIARWTADIYFARFGHSSFDSVKPQNGVARIWVWRWPRAKASAEA
jgi:hypothetical protein